jgi:alkylhydroperoxidase family enzyme
MEALFPWILIAPLEALTMSFDRKTSLPESWGITIEMMDQPRCRIPFVDPDNIPEDLRKELAPLYERSRLNLGTVPRFLQMLGHSQVFVEAWGLIEFRVRFQYLQTDPDFLKTLQLVIIKTAILNHSNNCTAHNVDLGLAVGFDWDQIDALEGDDWKESALFTPGQKSAIRWAEIVTRGTTCEEDEVFTDLQKHFTTRQILEMTFYCGMWNLSGRLTEAFHQTVEPPGKRIAFQSIATGPETPKIATHAEGDSP